jgi:hypothetical protein
VLPAPAPPLPVFPAPKPADPLVACLATARASSDVGAAMEACELEHVGVAWRAHAPGKTAPRLEPRLVQAGVRALFGRMRLCYENGLRNCPNLNARVSVRFVIDRNGRAVKVRDEGSDLPDQTVVQCVVKAIDGVAFPKPQGGEVTVVYPIIFSPGD